MSGDTIDLPIKANFREGLLPLEYFISTYGARKGPRRHRVAHFRLRLPHASSRRRGAGRYRCARRTAAPPRGVTYQLQLVENENDEPELNTDLIGRCFVEDVVAPSGEVLFHKDGYIERQGGPAEDDRRGSLLGEAEGTAYLPLQVRRVPEVLRLGSFDPSSRRHRHRGGHHRRAVHRRARHAAHDAYHPLRRRRRRRGHHARVSRPFRVCSTSWAT